MSLATPTTIRILQRKLYHKAKAEPRPSCAPTSGHAVSAYHNRMIDALCNLFTPSIESPNSPLHLVRERDVS